VLRDLRRAFRGLIAQPAFTLTAVITLALGVGVNALMLDVLDRLLIRPPSGVHDPQQVSRIYFSPAQGQGAYFSKTSEPDFLDLEAGLKARVDAMATFMGEQLSLGRGSSARLLHVVDYSDRYFDVLGLLPAIGVLPGRGAGTPPDAAVISHALWVQAFAGAPDVLGRALRLGTQTFTIVGVAPKGFTGIDFDPTDVWLPIDMRGPLRFSGWREQRGNFSQDVIARIKPGVSRSEIETLATTIYGREHHTSWDTGMRLVAGDLLLSRAPGANPVIDVALWVTAVSGLVLLIGCANVGGLLLVRGISRSRESAVKAALGASKWRLVREVLAEALLLGLAAGALAVILVIWADRSVPNLFADGLWQSMEIFDYRIAGLAALVSFIAVVLLSIIPVLRLAVSTQLLAGRHVDMHRGYSLALDGLLAGQVALTLPLLVGAGLFAISFRQARHQDIGLDIDHMVVVSTNLFEDGEPQRNHDVHRAIQQRLAQLPQVEAAALVMTVPLQGGMAFAMDIPDEVPGEGREGPYINAVDPSYLKAAGIRLVAGRPFLDQDNHSGAHRVALINQAMARERWGGKPVVGRCLYIYDRKTECVEVIGVIADAWLFPGRSQVPAFLVPIEPFRALSTSRGVIVRTAGQPEAVLNQVRHEAQAAGVNLPYVDVFPLADVLFTMLRPWKLGASMFIAFATLALLISAVGLAGTIAYAVGRRRRELGVRKALGAQSPHLVRVVLRRSVVVVIAGALIGLVGAYAAAGTMKSMLFGIEPNDWRVFAVAAAALFLVSILAAALPARRATLVDPAELLRAE
jgi:predicted permease